MDTQLAGNRCLGFFLLDEVGLEIVIYKVPVYSLMRSSLADHHSRGP